MPNRGRPWGQNRVHSALAELAQMHCYGAKLRSKDVAARESLKKFLPDVVANPAWGGDRRAFEVEATVNNNTIYKSLASLLEFLRSGGAFAYLIVPGKNAKFAQGCVDHISDVIKHFGRRTKGRHKKIEISILTFATVKADRERHEAWEANGRRGRPPKLAYLPRPK